VCIRPWQEHANCLMVLHAGGEGAWVGLDPVAGPFTSKVCAFLWPGQCHSSIESMDSQDAAWCTLSSSQVCAPRQDSDTQTPETLLRQNSALDAQMLQAVLPRGMVDSPSLAGFRLGNWLHDDGQKRRRSDWRSPCSCRPTKSRALLRQVAHLLHTWQCNARNISAKVHLVPNQPLSGTAYMHDTRGERRTDACFSCLPGEIMPYCR